jgi:hypothetical protein
VNVLPHIAEALITINRDQIDDPVYYMATFLHQRGKEVQERETNEAYESFMAAMRQAEAMEEAAAAQLRAISKYA